MNRLHYTARGIPRFPDEQICSNMIDSSKNDVRANPEGKLAISRDYPTGAVLRTHGVCDEDVHVQSFTAGFRDLET